MQDVIAGHSFNKCLLMEVSVQNIAEESHDSSCPVQASHEVSSWWFSHYSGIVQRYQLSKYNWCKNIDEYESTQQTKTIKVSTSICSFVVLSSDILAIPKGDISLVIIIWLTMDSCIWLCLYTKKSILSKIVCIYMYVQGS